MTAGGSPTSIGSGGSGATNGSAAGVASAGDSTTTGGVVTWGRPLVAAEGAGIERIVIPRE